MLPIWAKNILFLLVFMISGLVLIIIIDGLTSGTELIPLNTVIEQMITRVRTPFLTTVLVYITKLGDPFTLSFAAALIAILLVIKSNRYYDAVLFVAVIVVAVVSLSVLKNTFQISRPGSELISVSGWSFPSGHTTLATAFFLMLIYLFFRNLKTVIGKTFLITGSIVFAGLIYFSRLYLGAHWTLDILAGIALGLLSVSFTILVFNLFFGDRQLLRSRINL